MSAITLRKVVVALVASALVAVAVPLAAAAPSKTISVKLGSIGEGQSASALSKRDNSGVSDNWLGYVEFIPGAQRHRSIIDIVLPEVDSTATAVVVWNFRGPEWSQVRWKLNVRNLETNRWEEVFANRDTTGWVWEPGRLELGDPAPYLNGAGRMRFQFRSSNASDVGQLDQLRVAITPGEEPPPPPDDFPVNVPFDYQIGGAYDLPAGVGAVSRDWFDSDPAAGAYNLCYINAFQTQDDDASVDRPDERSNWPSNLVLDELGDDPNWGGEYLIDISTNYKRNTALAWLQPMIQTCADKGYDSIEFDNLDSWTRFDGTPVEALVPFDRADAITFATMLTEATHAAGLLSGQKNTADLTAGEVAGIGFDFAVVESCGQYNECDVFQAIHGDRIFAIEYGDFAFTKACAAVGDNISVVRRDRNVTTPDASTYRFNEC